MISRWRQFASPPNRKSFEKKIPTPLPKPPTNTTDHRAHIDDDKVFTPPTHFQVNSERPA